MGQNPNRTLSEHSNPTTKIGSNMVHLPRNGTIGFHPQPYLRAGLGCYIVKTVVIVQSFAEQYIKHARV